MPTSVIINVRAEGPSHSRLPSSSLSWFVGEGRSDGCFGFPFPFFSYSSICDITFARLLARAVCVESKILVETGQQCMKVQK